MKKIRLKQELCPKEFLDNPRKQFGRLNYRVLMLKMEWEPIGVLNNEYWGVDVVRAKVTKCEAYPEMIGREMFLIHNDTEEVTI